MIAVSQSAPVPADLTLAGVDGCRCGWIVASSDAALTTLQFAFVPTGGLTDLFAAAAKGRAIVAIDIPIGLWQHGDRPCDKAARARLGPGRGSSVFPPPARATVEADPATYEEACRINRAATGGRAISRQAANILPKIREVDRSLTDALVAAGIQRAVREAHPEVVFAVLRGNGGLATPKRTRAGLDERCRLLAPHLSPFDAVAVCGGFPGRPAQPDDVVDAAACLVAAARMLRGSACVLPGEGEWRDPRGLRMEIVA